MPFETKISDRFAQSIDESSRSLSGALDKYDAEFIAAKPRQYIGIPYAKLQTLCQLFEQFITGNVTTGIIDSFELIDIEIAKYVLLIFC